MTTPADGLPTPARYHAIAVLVLGVVLAVLDGTIVNLALPGITHELQASAASSIWVVNAYQLAIVGFLLPCAALGDLIGYRRVYLGGIAIFTLASVACFMANSLPLLAAARGVQGLGAAGIMAVNSALLRLVFPRHLLGRGIAMNSAVVATASVAGPSVAAAILLVASWPWLFALNVPLGLLVLALGWRALPYNTAAPAKGARLSALDVFLNAAMFGLVFLGIHELGTRAAASPTWELLSPALALTAGGIAIGFFYLRRQLREALPLFPVDLLRIPIFRLSMCTSVASFTAQTLAYVGLPFLMLDSWGVSPLEAAWLITPWPVAVVAMAPITGRLVGRYHGGLLGGIGLALMATGLALLAALPAHPVHADIVWRMALCGIGFGLFQTPNNLTILSSAPLHRSGASSGMLGTARQTGQSLGAVLLALIFSMASAHDGRGPTIALAVAAGFAAVASLFSLLRLRHAPAAVR